MGFGSTICISIRRRSVHDCDFHHLHRKFSFYIRVTSAIGELRYNVMCIYSLYVYVYVCVCVCVCVCV
jgi:hypothetical protein